MSPVTFLNEPETIIGEYIDAHALTEDVAKLETRGSGDAGGRILIRSDWSKDNGKVALLSGSGSGHEPANIEYIGKGLLTGAIQGEIFASPSVGAVQQAIEAVTGPAGCLLIVMDYTGDRLHFGLAAERARAKGLKVDMILLGDDVAFWDQHDDHPRGLAGTLLAQKVAGYHAEKGASLEDIMKAVKSVTSDLKTLALATRHANVPGKSQDAGGEPALGMGIHNEPGARSVSIKGATDAVKTVLDGLEKTLTKGVDKFILVLNDLGGCSVEERAVLTNQVLSQFGISRVSHILGPSTFITSCDMHGFSVTLLPSKPEFIEAFEAPTTAAGWRSIRPVHERKVIKLAAPESSVESSKPVEHDDRSEKIILAIAKTLLDAKKSINDLDALSGDGDTGDTYSAGAETLKKAIEAGKLPSKDPSELSARIAELLEDGMGGTSGILSSLIFMTASTNLKKGESWPKALSLGVENMQHYGGSKPGNRTILDALVPGLDAFTSGGSASDAAAAARKGADATKDMHASVGRAAHVPESSYKGHVDAGAEAIALIFDTLKSVL